MGGASQDAGRSARVTSAAVIAGAAAECGSSGNGLRVEWGASERVRCTAMSEQRQHASVVGIWRCSRSPRLPPLCTPLLSSARRSSSRRRHSTTLLSSLLLAAPLLLCSSAPRALRPSNPPRSPLLSPPSCRDVSPRPRRRVSSGSPSVSTRSRRSRRHSATTIQAAHGRGARAGRAPLLQRGPSVHPKLTRGASAPHERRSQQPTQLDPVHPADFERSGAAGSHSSTGTRRGSRSEGVGQGTRRGHTTNTKTRERVKQREQQQRETSTQRDCGCSRWLSVASNLVRCADRHRRLSSGPRVGVRAIPRFLSACRSLPVVF